MKSMLIGYGYILICIIALQIIACIYGFISISKSEKKQSKLNNKNSIEWQGALIGSGEPKGIKQNRSEIIGGGMPKITNSKFTI